MGVTSVIELISKPKLFNARTDESRPGPGPLIFTSSCRMPQSWAVRPAVSAATCAAKGVLLRLPRNPAPPEVAHDTAFPCRSVIVMIVLLNVAWTCATPSRMFLRTFAFVRFLFWTFAIQSVPLLIYGWAVLALFEFERSSTCADRERVVRVDAAFLGRTPYPSGA